MNFLSLAGSGSGVLKNTSLSVWHQRVGINFKVAASVARVSGELITKLTIKEKEMLHHHHHHHHHHLQLTASNIFFFALFDPWLRNRKLEVSPLCVTPPLGSPLSLATILWHSLRASGQPWALERPFSRITCLQLKDGSFSTKNPEGGRSPHSKPTRIQRIWYTKITRGWMKTLAIRSDFDFKFQDLGFWFRV